MLTTRWLRLLLSGVAAVLTVWVIRDAMRGETDAAALAALAVSVAALALQARSYARERSAPRPALDDQAAYLAGTLDTQWFEEAAARRLRDPQILALSWEETDRPVAPERPIIDGPDGLRQRPRIRGRLDGDFDGVIKDLAARYRLLPEGRLVVLGEPGAGKSVLGLLLTLGLLRDRAPGERVPVLLSASSWDPLAEDLDAWIVRSVAEGWYHGRAEVPTRLLRANRLLPVIDGLDEIAEAGRRRAARLLNNAVRRGSPLVVTCRSIEYEDLIRGGAPVLIGVPVVEVQPVPPADVEAYFSAIDWPDGTRWDAVHAAMRATPDSPVAAALSTPLMVSLARLIYQKLGGDPAELLDPGRFDSRHAVEDDLADRVVDAAYAPDSSPSRWRVEDARRWLTFIAAHLHRHGQRDLVWWQLAPRLLSAWTAPILGIGGGVLTMIAVASGVELLADDRIGLNVGVIAGASAGGVTAVLTMVLWFAALGRPPGRLSFALAGSAERLRRGFTVGYAVAGLIGVPVLTALVVIIGLLSEWRLITVEQFAAGALGAAAVATVLGAALGGHNWLNAPPARAVHASPAGSIRDDRRSALAGSALAGLIALVGTPLGLIVGVWAGSLVTKVSTGWAGWPGEPAPGLLLAGLTRQITVGRFGTWQLAVAAMAVLPGVVVAMLVLLSRAWPRFALVRASAAIRGQLPWRLMAFLGDARQRELLRQVAGSYQFRHIRLQERLAAAPAPATGSGRLRPALTAHRGKLVAGLIAAGLAAVMAPLVALPANGATHTLRGPGVMPISEFQLIGHDAYAVTISGADRARLWELSTGTLVSDLVLPIPAAAPMTNRTFYTAFGENRRFLWIQVIWQDAATPTLGWIFEVPSGRLLKATGTDEASVLDDGRTWLLAGSDGRSPDSPPRLEVWDAVENSAEVVPDGMTGEDLANGMVLSGEVLRHLASGREVVLRDAARSALNHLLTDPAHDRVWVTSEAGAGVWRLSDGALVRRLAATELERGAGYEFAEGNRWVFASTMDQGRLRVWDSASGRLMVETPLARGAYSSAMSMPGGGSVSHITRNDRLLALGPSGSVEGVALRVWDVPGRREIIVIPDVSASWVSDDAQALATSVDGRSVQVWDVRSGRRRAEFVTSLSGTDFATLNPSGTAFLERDGAGDYRMWNTVDGRMLRQLGAAETSTVGFMAEREILVVETADGRTRFYSTEHGGEVAVVDGLPSGIGVSEEYTSGGGTLDKIMDFSPDQTHMISASHARERLEIWNVAGTGWHRPLVGHTGPVASFEFTEDNRRLVTHGTDGTVRVWDLP